MTRAPISDAQRGVVQTMCDRLIHRGPDSEGHVDDDHIMLAMRRLSIVDLAGGKQPLFNEARDIAIICNGEIYNHDELRTELSGLGHTFSSHSDVETIVHAYEEYGLDCLGKLRGMFAFALWDSKKGEMLLARDQLGEKPLYLHRNNDALWFSSEIRSLSAALGSPLALTTEAFNLFLTFQYIPEPVTPISGVEQFPAGHYLLVTPDNLAGQPVSFVDLAHAHERSNNPVRVTEEVLDKACRMMGTADVPVAVALSGGIDSSLVAALTARHFPGQLHAFTIGYEGRPASDERSFARTLASELGIGFTEVEIANGEVVDSFPTLMSAMDTPIGDIAAFGYYSVARASRAAGYPVLLSGLGGDEFFWGYEWVREAMARNEAILAGNATRLPWWKRLLGKRVAASPDFFGVHAELRNGDTLSRTLLPANRSAELPEGYWLQQVGLDLSRPLHLATVDLLNRTWLRSNCLALMDRMTMAHSVEGRLPLLDTELVERVTGMRNDGLEDWREPHKWLLVEALQDALPADVLSRKKQGFTPPVRDWMNGIVKRYLPLVENGALVRQGLVDPGKSGRYLAGLSLSFLYKLVLLECWVRLHLDGQSPDDLLSATA